MFAFDLPSKDFPQWDETAFRAWRRQLGNFFDYVDFNRRLPDVERALFSLGLEPVEAGEIIIKSLLEYNSKQYICE